MLEKRLYELLKDAPIEMRIKYKYAELEKELLELEKILKEEESKISRRYKNRNYFNFHMDVRKIWDELEHQYPSAYDCFYWEGRSDNFKNSLSTLDIYYQIEDAKAAILSDAESMRFVSRIMCVNCWKSNVLKHGFNFVQISVKDVIYSAGLKHNLKVVKDYESQRFLCRNKKCNHSFTYGVYRRTAVDMLKAYILTRKNFPKYLIAATLEISQATLRKYLKALQIMETHSVSQASAPVEAPSEEISVCEAEETESTIKSSELNAFDVSIFENIDGKIICPYCATADVVKHSRYKNGKWRYKCKNSECPHSTFTEKYTYKAHDPRAKASVDEGV